MAAQLSSDFGSGQPQIDLLIATLILATFAFAMIILRPNKKITKYEVIDVSVVDTLTHRISELEIAIGELKSYVKQNTEQLRGETGYIKYAQTELLDALIELRNGLPPPVNHSKEIFITEDKRVQRLTGQKVVGE